MKSKVAAITLLVSTTMVGYSTTLFAETCYDASGSVTTENITSTLQMGNISLTLSDSGSPVFSETGSLVGNITGADSFGATLLSHKARFPQGDSFVTSGDKAELAFPYVLDTLEDGTPCSFWIHETISNIAKGTRFFKNVTSGEIFADGYISNCPNENENHFELSGQLCVE
jgi:hypothetical protein